MLDGAAFEAEARLFLNNLKGNGGKAVLLIPGDPDGGIGHVLIYRSQKNEKRDTRSLIEQIVASYYPNHNQDPVVVSYALFDTTLDGRPLLPFTPANESSVLMNLQPEDAGLQCVNSFLGGIMEKSRGMRIGYNSQLIFEERHDPRSAIFLLAYFAERMVPRF